MDPLAIARELEAIAQTGLHFSRDPYDRERYQRLRMIAAEMLSSLSNRSFADILAWSKAEFGYATPKVDTRAFIVSSNKILLIRENADAGRWTLPGGWADVNETPSESIVREVEEESGYVVTPLRLLAVFDREAQKHPPPFPYHVYKLIFQCEIVGGAPRATSESSESKFFAVDDLPELSHSRVLPVQIESLYERVRSGLAETLFD